MTPPDDVLHKLQAIPQGTSIGTALAKRYVVTRSAFSGGRALKLVGEELGGTDYVSLNIYLLKSGARLFPCEMSSDKVIAFVRAYVPEGTISAEPSSGS